ncbi:hypothetical protein VitviT2T_026580 [Vitis vinifera]|uniref:Uncharacterized protein n=2 Tax=Vitis vinifera TaxID=29760 RepID=A0ABY9DR56_VITVI|nr:uncharacterized protein LOC100249354 isoform X1 [Vitis vinifera]WKA08896.1 hypothetical protein VitviT2T_026580 [Vitis vinifera]|eukprot:XP_002271813.1 PREDICTED: uncharacterized protein LOC100249354 isoform X1 [Vitis vinifera]
MATSAFKSTTKRSSIGTPSRAGTSSSSAHRRSRSLSRFSRKVPAAEEEDFEEVPVPKGRFVNTVRGSGFPEISLDDLAVDFFGSAERGRSSESSVVGHSVTAGSSQRRGRSVSRRGADGNGCTSENFGVGRAVSDNNSRRRRSVSVVRQQISDYESDVDLSQNYRNRANLKSFSDGNGQMPSSQKPTISNHRRFLGRSLSQKDLLKSNDGYSSQSSAVTDDEARDGCSSKNGIVKTIRAVYAQKKAEHPTGDDVNGGLYEAMRKELRHAVEEIKMELEQAMANTNTSGDHLQSNNSDVLDVSTVRRNYATKLEQSEKRKQDLLAEILLEEQRGRELSKIVKELLPDSKDTASVEKPSRARKRSNDRNRMSKRLTEEAEKYFEDFISNVEDTDISSFDGERSDGSSTLSGITKPREPEKHSREPEIFRSPAPSYSLPSEMDGLVLPWLQWETHNDSSPLSCNKKTKQPVTPKTLVWDSAQEGMNAQDQINRSISSHGSWSPGIVDSPSINTGHDLGSKFGGPGSSQGQSFRRSGFDMDEYESLKCNEDLLFERWRQRQRINSGGLLLCGNILL